MWFARVLSVALRSRGSVAGLNGRTTTRAGSGRRNRPVGSGTCVTRHPRAVTIGRDGASRGSAAADSPLPHASQRAHLRESEQIRHDGFAAPVLVRPLGMQAIAAASRFEIDQRHGQIVAAEKPCEGALRIGFPLGSPSARRRRDRPRSSPQLPAAADRTAGARCACRRSSQSPRAGRIPLPSSAASSASAAIAGRRSRIRARR